MSKLTKLSIAASLALTSVAHAQVAPDAGRALQQEQPPLQPPRPSAPLTITSPMPTKPAPGGMTVTLKTVAFHGNTVFTEAELTAAVADAIGRPLDLAGLWEVANLVSEHYRRAGYPFARAYLPPQPVSDGRLQVEVVEGKYGRIQPEGDEDLFAGTQRFLASLQPGGVIESRALERATLLLDDQPGIKAVPVIRPGQELGTGDLNVRVTRERTVSGEVGLDNHGNRYNGEYRARLDLQADSPFLFGDQVQFHGLLTDEHLWLGSVSYSLPLGASGLRGQVGYAHTYYELGKQFAVLDATGTAKVTTAGLSHPLLRSQRANATVALNYQHKDLEDRKGATGTTDDKYSDSLPLGLQFDFRDSLGSGAVTFGTATWTPGRLHLDSNQKAVDQTTARKNGDFSKFNLDVARLQALPAGFTGYGRLSGQWADGNLDSSEGFGLGGPNGVRAYPVGEGYGDKGWLAEIELRYTLGAFAPYAFYDAGGVRINAKPWTAASNQRNIAGAGLGVRFQQGPWNGNVAVAWRTEGGRAQSDTLQRDPMFWVTIGYKL